VAVGEDVQACAPRIRQFARALVVGSPASDPFADGLVRAALDAAACEAPPPGNLDAYLASFVIHKYRDRLSGGGSSPPSPAPFDRLARRLLTIPLYEREALLLIVAGGFGYAEAAKILRVSREVLVARLGRARAALGDIAPTRRVAPRAKTPPAYLRVVK